MSGRVDRDRAVDEMLRRSRAGQSRTTVPPPSSACLDPETLALWVDDGLSSAERAAAERHVADCARCQATLAALVRTAPVAEVRQPWWRVSRVAWLAPLTAAAAALVIWIVVPSAPPTPSPAPPATVSAPPALLPQPATQNAENAPARANSAPPAAAERRDETRLAEKPAAMLEQKQQAQAPASEVAAAPVPAAAPPPPAAASAPAAAPPPQAIPALPAPALRSFSGVAADGVAKSAARANAILAEIVSPEPMSRWRIAGARTIEHSVDGGATWQAQLTDATSALTAGSAPSTSVCWVVGQDGVVLLSTDGRTWRRIGFPTTAALVAIRAADERTATVTDVDGRTYATSDGGGRWTQGQ